jgi:chemotaxis protein methyltransferase CheR
MRRFVTERASREELDVLFSRLTIGETYFFRDPAAFELLQQRVLPEIIRARRSSAKRLRIWSAGCCSGEEPYSIAIAVSRALPDLADWEVTIVGTDINQRFLHKAEAGIYTQWSFRGTSEALKTHYFRRTAEDRFEIIPPIRKLVTFACVNLVEDVFPSLLTNTNAIDVIFCRNVLMYFSRDQAKKVAASLHRSLLEDGWLFPSGTEASRELFGQFTQVEVPGTIVYRKTAPPAPSAPPPAVPEPALVLPPERPPTREAAPAVPAVPAEPAPPATPQPAPFTARAHQLANEGRLDDALAACDKALEADKLAPIPHYLRGLILQEQGAHDAAMLALRRALYLDPSFVLAHFALGSMLRRDGRRRDAARCFENARTLLRRYDPDAALPEADGLTAGRLLATLEIQESTT